MQKIYSLVSFVTLFAVVIATSAAGVIFAPNKANAIGNASIYWVYSAGGAGNRIVNAQEAATLTPTAITPATTAGYTARTIATDGSYIYFVDNSSASLVRTDMAGAGRTVIIASTSGIQQVAVQGGKVYYVEWDNGVYSVPVTGGTPTQIIAPSFITNTCAGAPGGWGGINITADNLFFSWYNGSATYSACYGVYKATRTGATFGTPTKLPAPGGSWTTAGWLQLDGNDLYISQSGTTIDKTTDYSTWTHYNVSAGSFSLQALSVYSSTIYMVSNTGSVYTMPKSDTAGASITRLFTNVAASSGWQILATAPPTYTITFTNGGGTGVDLVQTIAQGSTLTLPSPTACPLSATDPCFTAPAGQRARDWHVTAGSLSGGATYPSIGDTVTPTSNVTFDARWTGGPLTFSTTSGGAGVSSIVMPNTSVGSTSSQTIYVKNSSSTASEPMGNVTTPTSDGLLRNGGTCTTGNTLATLDECTIIMTWTPSVAGSISANTTISIQYGGGALSDSVTLTGTSATNKTVIFNPGSGSGTMANQLAAFPSNLAANAFTRTGYSFSYWTMFSDGSGTQFLNQGSFPFNNASPQNLYANWSADSHVVTFNTDGGSAVANGSFNTDGSMNLPTAPIKAGYTFNGWFAAPTGGTALSSPYSPPGTSAITLYAQWSVDTSGGSGSNGNLPYTGNQTDQILGISGALLTIGLAITAFAIYRRRKA